MVRMIRVLGAAENILRTSCIAGRKVVESFFESSFPAISEFEVTWCVLDEVVQNVLDVRGRKSQLCVVTILAVRRQSESVVSKEHHSHL